jgi:hypothetical protein
VFRYGGTGCQGVAAVADVTVPGNVLLSNSSTELAAVQLSWYLAQQNQSFVLELQPSPDVLDGPAEINIDLASASSCRSLHSGCFLPSTGLCVMGLCTNMKVLVGVFGGWFAVAVASVNVYVNASTVTVLLTRSAFSMHAATSVLSLQLDQQGAALPCLANVTALANITWSGNDTVAAVVIPLTFDPMVQITGVPVSFDVRLTAVVNGAINQSAHVTTVHVVPVPLPVPVFNATVLHDQGYSHIVSVPMALLGGCANKSADVPVVVWSTVEAAGTATPGELLSTRPSPNSRVGCECACCFA